MVRRILLMFSMAGGVWLSFQLLNELGRRAGGGHEIQLTGEGALLAAPVALIGAMVGLLVGGILFPPSN